MGDRADLMLRLTRSLASKPHHEPLPLRLCLAFEEIVHADGGAIALGFSVGQRSLVCATSEQARRFEDAQDLVHEGPSLDAMTGGRAVVSLTLADRRARWPRLDGLVDEQPLTAVRALPIRPDDEVIGVLTVHHAPGVALARSLDDLQFLTDAVGAAIVGDLPRHDDESRLWSERDRVSQATGMVIAQLGLLPDDALAVLRAHAFAQELSVAEVSRLVVERTLDFSLDRGGAP